MQNVSAQSSQEMADILKACSEAGQPINVWGSGTKRLWRGVTGEPAFTISTLRLDRVLQYERNDLTISVEAGMPWSKLQQVLGEQEQMIGMDPPHADEATVGGVIASGISGPLQQRFGTARDLVIGTTFATTAGRLIESGGMVVKNVAGLDFSKLMIGSWGTLAILTTVNFRVHPKPETTRTYAISMKHLTEILKQRHQVLQSPLRPMCLDLLNPAAAAILGFRDYTLFVRGGGSPKVLARFDRELKSFDRISGPDEVKLWTAIREFSPGFLMVYPEGILLKIDARPAELNRVLEVVPEPCIARGNSGQVLAHLRSSEILQGAVRFAERGWRASVLAAPINAWELAAQAVDPASTYDRKRGELMAGIKRMFDGKGVLNPSQSYGFF